MPGVDPEIFHAKVYDICRLIPSGKVTSYGHIAKLAGHPSHARLVGQALKFVGDPTVPWQRVVSASGAIADRGDGGDAAARQAHRLIQEGVAVAQAPGSLSWRINLATYGWFPQHVDLPDYSGSEGEQDDDDQDFER